MATAIHTPVENRSTLSLVAEYLDSNPQASDNQVSEDMLRRYKRIVRARGVASMRGKWKKARSEGRTLVKDDKLPTKKKAPRERLQLTDEQKKRLIEETATIQLQRPAATLTKCFATASQRVLGKPIKNTGSLRNRFPWLEPGVVDYFARIKDLSVAGERTEQMSEEFEALEQLVAEEAVNKLSIPEILSLLLGKFSAEIRSVVRSEVQELSEGLQHLPSPTSPSNGHVNGKSARTFKKFRFVVLGLLPTQVENLRRACVVDPKVVELIVIDVNHQGKEIPRGADVVINWTKFSTRQVEAKVRQYYQGNQFVRFAGGFSELVSLVKERLMWVQMFLQRYV